MPSCEDLPTTSRRRTTASGVPEAEKHASSRASPRSTSPRFNHKINEELERQGVIFMDTDTALKKKPEIFQEYFGTVVAFPGDNKFSALNTAV